MAVFRVEKTKDYTVMSNRHLRDRALSLKAKGLLTLMLSLPENWDYTLQGLSIICKEGIDAIREGVRELERAGYVQRDRVRNEKGQLLGCEYVIYENPQPAEEEPAPESTAQEKPAQENPMQEKPAQESPALESPALEKPAQSNTHVSKTYISKNQKSNPYPSNGAGTRDGCDEMEPAATEREIRFLRAEVHEQIEYDCIVTVGNRELLDELVELMVEALSSRRETLSISGEERPTWLVQERLRKLNAHHIEYVLNCLQSNRTKIHNIKWAVPASTSDAVLCRLNFTYVAESL